MAGKIPGTFIDSLIARVDIVDVVDRRVPLTRKGKEYQACCPFHEEKTPSFTVSPSKQFYHCFGCGAHGTAIGFLMDYANLSFVEAVEELADGLGMDVPREETGNRTTPPEESSGQLLGLVDEASNWFQLQLRKHPNAREAISYLKGRGLDGRICAQFGIGFAPDSWDGLTSALGTSDARRNQLLKVGLVTRKEAEAGNPQSDRMYDRFRGRIIFPIEDHRGRTVAFGGRILGAGEPKYLNSPETSLFHKGAELYGLHRARRAIGQQNRSVVVEGYMDVIGLAQFGVEHAVATLGTATTRTHLQRLFRLAPEIIFCFDGDRAGRDAAWKAMQVAMPEMQDGRQLGFLFLPDGEDPDTIVRQEGAEAFYDRITQALPLEQFLFDSLMNQVDMTRMDGKARLVSLAKPLIEQMPQNALREMMHGKLAALTGLSGDQMPLSNSSPPTRTRARRPQQQEAGQLSPMALAISLILQAPSLAKEVNAEEIAESLSIQGAEYLQEVVMVAQSNTETSTARLVEHFRETEIHSYIERLASHSHQMHEDLGADQLKDVLTKLQNQQLAERAATLLEKSRNQALDAEEKRELLELMDARKTHLAGS